MREFDQINHASINRHAAPPTLLNEHRTDDDQNVVCVCMYINCEQIIHAMIKSHPRVSTPFTATYIPVNYLILYVASPR